MEERQDVTDLGGNEEGDDQSRHSVEEDDSNLELGVTPRDIPSDAASRIEEMIKKPGTELFSKYATRTSGSPKGSPEPLNLGQDRPIPGRAGPGSDDNTENHLFRLVAELKDQVLKCEERINQQSEVIAELRGTITALQTEVRSSSHVIQFLRSSPPPVTPIRPRAYLGTQHASDPAADVRPSAQESSLMSRVEEHRRIIPPKDFVKILKLAKENNRPAVEAELAKHK